MFKKILLILIFFLFSSSFIWAASVSSPLNLLTEVTINQAFNVDGEISGWQAGEVYFIKCRIGSSFSSLNEGQTYNPLTNSWLNDSSAWVEMPITENANFSLQCRIKSGVEAGSKIIFLRACLKKNESCSNSFQSATGTDLIALAEPTPSPSPTPTPNPTPISSSPRPTPTPKLTATYKINEVKNEDGEILKSVKVYLDDIYLHHYAPEVLTFCDGCQCDGLVDCGFGQHTIKLEKTGYENWSKTVDIISGTVDEVNPVMIFLDSTSAPTPTPTSSPTPTPSLTPKPTSKTATVSGEVLGGETATLSSFYPYEATGGAEENESLVIGKNKIWPKIFLICGLIVLFASGFWLWYTFKE